MKNRSYSELIQYSSLKDRYEYLKLRGEVGVATFGYDRYFNQYFYRSKMWKDARRKIIIRDKGCDLGVDGYEIKYRLTIHHINPITKEDIESENYERLLDPENLITVSYETHKAIHYGDTNLLPKVVLERSPNDTCPWRQI